VSKGFKEQTYLSSISRVSAQFMRGFFQVIPTASTSDAHADKLSVVDVSDKEFDNSPPDLDAAVRLGYESDLADDEPINMVSEDEGGDLDGADSKESNEPRRKRRRTLEVPVTVQRRLAGDIRRKELGKALDTIEKFIKSRKTAFPGGDHGLQAQRARAIQSYLQLIVRKGFKGVNASEMAAMTHGFGKTNGGRLIRQWGNNWMKNQELPLSERGCHVKVTSLLDDPNISNEILSYLRSNKWATHPKKLAAFHNNELLPAEAEKYVKNIVDKEMPRAMKRHLELELFPRICMKVGKGISVSTARRWMFRHGFHYMQYKKALYFDGHERPDVVHYRQNIFLPAMEKYRLRLVEYEIGEVSKEVSKPFLPGVRKLVLCAHDESTMQANDGMKAGWGPEGEQPLLKKGPGRGSHRSDIICSTFGWLKEAGQQLEYGKNYDGYWTGELFVQQVSGFNFFE